MLLFKGHGVRLVETPLEVGTAALFVLTTVTAVRIFTKSVIMNLCDDITEGRR